jgi:type II secretory pathway pseudopilin PulG
MRLRANHFHPQSAFTMVEVAISLAIISFALLAIVGNLPMGMNVQRENREATLVSQDATVFMEAISKGASGLNDLTNYVYAITNNRVLYQGGNPSDSPIGYDTNYLTTGARIVGLMSTPEYTDPQGDPISTTNGVSDYVRNHVVACVRSLSGPAVEKPPQDNDIVRGDSFTYQIVCVNAPLALDPGTIGQGYPKQLSYNQRELRFTFLWPVRPNGTVGGGRQTFRASVLGQMSIDKTVSYAYLYFFQPQSFNSAP